MSKHIALDTRVQNLEFEKPWKLLSTKEKNYAYYLSKAAWAGAKIVPHQISYESPAIFVLLQIYFASKDFDLLERSAKSNGVSDDEWRKFIAYCAGFFSNMSNYHAFGHMKFVPELDLQKFKTILFTNPAISAPHMDYSAKVELLFDSLAKEIFIFDKPYTQLNFYDEGGVTAYYSSNVTKADLALAREFMKSQQIDPLNTRVWKSASGEFEISIASIHQSEETFAFKDTTFKVKKGEFHQYLQEVVHYLRLALPYCANELQREMLELYIEHYETGSIDKHKDSQRRWIKDIGPVVESNQGFIESYIDPENVRAYFEAWVAIVNKDRSAKFKKLVENSEQIIPKLPWPKMMEKDSFLAPDFTTLEVICFATNSCPLGINIPNYDDIRDNEGFKNVFLSNSFPSYAISSMQFATEEQKKWLTDNTQRCYEVHVACHELLGHGVGKLIYRDASGSAPEFVDPINQEAYSSCYEAGETWNEKFGAISASYEECRADTCGFYLCTLKEVYSLFGFEDDEVDTLLWVNVMNQFRKGLLGLQLYNAETNKWGQAHTQGAFVFAMYIYRNQKSQIVDFEIVGNGEDFYIHLNKELLNTEGKKLIEEFLVILQTYKSSGAAERATLFYNDYSQVNEFFLRVREIVIEKKKPRRLELNNNLIRYNEEVIEPRVYPETLEAIILSFADRYPLTPAYVEQVLSVWNEHKEDLRMKE